MMDRISDLPNNIIDSILTRLEIKEAARTCILSRSWRYHWHFLSKISINCDHFYGVPEVEFEEIINHIFLFHRGSIDKLELTIDLEKHNSVDRWILYASRNGIKELIIDNCAYNHYYNVPSSIFACSDLTCLRLTHCIVKAPTAIKAIYNLKSLCIFGVRIDSKVLESVINSCPLLSQLCLELVEPAPSLKINAPKLLTLTIVGFRHFPRLMNTPLLDSAYFALKCSEASANEDCNIVQLLGSMPFLRRLELDDTVLQHLAVGNVPTCLSSICQIKHLQAYIDFEDLQASLVAFCILRSSPFIQHLQIMASLNKNDSRISSNVFWKGEYDFSFKLDLLQTVELSWLTGSECELKFIEFLLSNAPALKTMFISFATGVEEKVTALRKLIRFPRISPKAELILPTYCNQ